MLTRAIADAIRDLQLGLRLVRRNPAYAITAVLCLALGIGVNSTVFSFLDGIYFRSLPVPDPLRIVAIDRNGSAPAGWRDYLAFRGDLRAFRGVAASQARGTFMDIQRNNFAIVAETVSANYADVLRVRTVIGRWFTPEDELPGSEPPVVLSAAIWERYFHRDRDVLGRRVRIETQWYRVVGVAPENFRGVSPPLLVDAWLPLVTFPIFRARLNDPRTPGPEVNLTGRLARGATLASAAAEMAVADAHLRQQQQAREKGYITPIAVSPFRGIPSAESRRSYRSITAFLLALVAVVLLIAGVNVANLLLSRAAVRQREMALRRALGASRSRLVRQGLAEGVVLAAGGAALGLLFGRWTNSILSLWLPASVPQSFLRGISLDMNWRVAVFTAAVALGCGVLFSLAPAFEACTFTRGSHSRQRDVYAVIQVALSLMLLVAAGLLLRALQRTEQIDPGFATDHRAYVRLFAPDSDFTPEAGTRLFTRLLEQARAIPGVRDATLSFAVLGFSDGECISPDRAATSTGVALNVVEPNYFEMMRVPLLRGRNFAAYDAPGGVRAVIVNETMARQRWPGRDPIGQTLWLGCGERTPRVAGQIIGVARDSKYDRLDEEPRPFLYYSREQVWWNGFFALIVQTAGNPADAMEPLIQLARTGGPDLRMCEVRTFDELVARSLWRVRLESTLLGVFGLLAVALSVVGLYGVVSCAVAQRTHEIGIRMALGAQRLHVQWMVLERGLKLAAAGIAAGLLLSGAASRLLRSTLYGVSPLDPVVFAGAALLWLVIALLASYIPARRAVRINPAVSLKYE